MNRIWNGIAFQTLLLGTLLLSGERALAATAGDYDGDGKADPATIDADKPEDKTSVFVKLSRNGAVKPFVFWETSGESDNFVYGDFVISGNFFPGNSKTYPGVVSKRGSVLKWFIKKSNGKQKIFTFGVKADKVPNQGDLDCDGTTDYVLVHQEADGSRTWQARLSSDPLNTATTSFGNTGDAIFTADVDGDGCSEIGVISAGYVWSTRPFSGSTVTDVTFGQAGDIPLPPANLSGDSAAEYVSVRFENGREVAHIRASDASETTANLGGTKTTPMIGNFFGSGNTFAWLDRINSKIVEVKPAGGTKKVTASDPRFVNPRRGILRPDGIGIPEGKTGKFGTTP